MPEFVPKVERIIQLDQLADAIGVEYTDDTQKAFSAIMRIIAYMTKGDQLSCADVSFTKLSDDLLHVDTKIDSREVVDDIAGSRLMRIPL